MTDTAHQYWNDTWSSAEGRADWEAPDPWVEGVAKTLAPGSRVLDLGCGPGRHALMYARMGHQTTGCDAATEGLEALKAAAGDLPVGTDQAMMTALPYADGSFDHVLSYNVIYHGDQEIVSKAIAQIARVLRPGGLFQGTMLTDRRLLKEQAKAPGREISPGTWVFDVDEGDKRHPHFFADAGALVRLFAEFDMRFLADEVFVTGVDKGHWLLIAERR